MQNQFLSIVLEYFPYGIRPSSLVDRRKFIRCYNEKFNTQLPVQEDNLEYFSSLANSVCVRVDKSFYAISQSKVDSLQEIIGQVMQSGANTIYFSNLYEKFMTKFNELGIASVDILKQAVKKFFPYPCANEFFQIRYDKCLLDEILSAIGTQAIIKIDELASSLPFVPKQKILEALKKSDKILSIDGNSFVLLNSVVFDEQEAQLAQKKVKEEVQKNGFILTQDICLNKSYDMNPDIPEKTLSKIFTSTYLSGNYVCQAKVISARNKKITGSELLYEYCTSKKSFNLDQLFNASVNFRHTNLKDRLFIARSVAIQIDKNNFVEQNAIDFDVDETDKAIALLTECKPVPLKSIKSFSLLPAIIGYQWNSYLLWFYEKLCG